MHIPDGYLSPSTCAVLYAGALTGWYAALRRLKRVMMARVVPLIAVFAAFAFVVMMFNLPLPGGTTGHAIGVTIAAIVLGPAGAILSISLATAIQALFFGDGGISTLGANCFNMAIAGSLVAYGVYRVLARRSAVESRRRVVAAGVAGYLAINASALAAAVEFGIQPALFHTANGTPLYAPYPLHIAIPAMMIGHLTFAGLAEAALAAGLVAYLQAADPALLRATSGIELSESSGAEFREPVALRRLWAGVAVLLVLTPLGILAAGKAWGEWSPGELRAAEVRHQVSGTQRASQLPPPAGLQALAGIWTAPFPSYAPGFVRSPSLGYLLSGMFGVGVVLAISLITGALLRNRRRAAETP